MGTGRRIGAERPAEEAIQSAQPSARRIVLLSLSLSLLVFSPACGGGTRGDSSLEFGGRGFPAPDYCAPIAFDDAVGDGVLVSVWTKISYPIVPPDFRGNQNVCRVFGDNWDIICLDGNLAANPDGSARYNANFMLGYGGSWGGDFCTYYSLPSEGIAMDRANGWVWAAWQVVVNADRSMTLRQWLKFGPEGTVFPAGLWSDLDGPGEERVAPGGVSLDGGHPIPADFDPSPPRSIQIGDDNSYSGSGYDTVPPPTPSNSYLYHAKLYARADKPSLEELEAMAMDGAPDGRAWGDWKLSWVMGAPLLSDASGNGHHLRLMPGGALFEGDPSPGLLF